MIPNLLTGIKEIKELRVRNLVAFSINERNFFDFDVDKDVAVISKQKAMEFLGTFNVNEIEKEFKKLKEKGIIVNYWCDNTNFFRVEINQCGFIDFMCLRIYYNNEQEMRNINALSATSFLKFWFLVKEANYEDFTASADELSEFLKMKKYKLTQVSVRDNKCFLDRLVENMNNAGIYLRYKFVNGKNIRDDIKFKFYNNRNELILNKIKTVRHLNFENKKSKDFLVKHLVKAFKNKKEYPINKKIIKTLTKEENEILLYTLLNYVSSLTSHQRIKEMPL